MQSMYFNENPAMERVSLNTLLYIYVAIGLMLLFSACEGNYYMVIKQGVHVLLASCVLLLVQRMHCEQLQKIAILLYGATILLLVLVLI